MAMAIAMTMAHFSRSGEYLWKNEDQKRDIALLHGAGTRLGVVVIVPSPQLLILSRFLFFFAVAAAGGERVGRTWKSCAPVGRTDGWTDVQRSTQPYIHHPLSTEKGSRCLSARHFTLRLVCSPRPFAAAATAATARSYSPCLSIAAALVLSLPHTHTHAHAHQKPSAALLCSLQCVF